MHIGRGGEDQLIEELFSEMLAALNGSFISPLFSLVVSIFNRLDLCKSVSKFSMANYLSGAWRWEGAGGRGFH